jgi:hypothetical protein
MKYIISIFLFFCYLSVFSQVNPKADTIRVENYPKDSISAKVPKSEIKILSDIEKVNAPLKIKVNKYNPTKAGLYSAVLPGLGQVYNKKYWKVPLVWGAVGTGVGIAIWNDNQYTKYRGRFVAKLNGTPNEFNDTHPWLDANALGNMQDTAKRQRDYAIAITGLLYILNIVDAVVDAHLYEGRHDPDLSIRPNLIYDQMGVESPKTGLSLNYRF